MDGYEGGDCVHCGHYTFGHHDTVASFGCNRCMECASTIDRKLPIVCLCGHTLYDLDFLDICDEDDFM